MQYITAYGVVEFGGLQKGQPLLVTAAASSVGIAAIQIAKLVGAITIATTRNKSKAKALADAGADFVINTETEDLCLPRFAKASLFGRILSSKSPRIPNARLGRESL
jgi:NADPH:quinone reductase-like Zn-dependent oxidoreductase